MTARKTAAPRRSPAQVEAEGGDSLFRWEKFEVDVPTDMDDWPTLVIQKFQRGQNIDAVELLFGSAKWVEFNVLYPSRKQFNDMMTELNRHVGIESGN